MKKITSFPDIFNTRKYDSPSPEYLVPEDVTFTRNNIIYYAVQCWILRFNPHTEEKKFKVYLKDKILFFKLVQNSQLYFNHLQ